MISLGQNIQSSDDILRKCNVEQIVASIRSPKFEIQNLITQLRRIYTIDSHKYSLLKCRLPYIVCGIFSPSYRKKANFAYTKYFILDFDHLTQKDMTASYIKNIISQDNRVMCCFVSPSEDGLKVLFEFKENCYDSGLYSIFYKKFANIFASQMHLEQLVDTVTSDVSRACFLSYDPAIYYNPSAETVDINSFVNTDDVNIAKRASIVADKVKEEDNSKKISNEPDKDVMDNIKSILGTMSRRRRKEPDYFVPQALENIIGRLQDDIIRIGIEIESISNIQYGKRIRLSLGYKKAEVNLYYGKRGFSVVETTRSGTDKDFCHTCSALILGLVDRVTEEIEPFE